MPSFSLLLRWREVGTRLLATQMIDGGVQNNEAILLWDLGSCEKGNRFCWRQLYSRTHSRSCHVTRFNHLLGSSIFPVVIISTVIAKVHAVIIDPTPNIDPRVKTETQKSDTGNFATRRLVVL